MQRLDVLWIADNEFEYNKRIYQWDQKWKCWRDRCGVSRTEYLLRRGIISERVAKGKGKNKSSSPRVAPDGLLDHGGDNRFKKGENSTDSSRVIAPFRVFCSYAATR